MVKDANTCVGAAADMLIDSLLLGYADACTTRALDVTILPKVMRTARRAVLHVYWRDVARPEHQEAGSGTDGVPRRRAARQPPV